MAVPSMNSSVGWAPQSAMGTPATGAFNWHKMTSAGLQPIEQAGPLPPELGGGLLPDGLYKGAYWTRGSLEFVPRLDQALGWLLWSLAGTGAITGSSPYGHHFPGQADNLMPNKWLTFHRRTQKSDGSYFGEEFSDCKVASFTLNAVPGEYLTCSADIRGRIWKPEDNCSGAGWDPAVDGGYENYFGVPIATLGSFEMPDGVALTNIQRASLTIDNGMADDRSMLVLGSYSPHDVLAMSRNIRIEATAFWTDATQYLNLYANGGSAWSPIIYTSYSPFDMYFQTPNNLAGKAYPGTIGFYAATDAISWTITPTPIRGGTVIMLTIVGIVNATTSGESWRLYLNNGRETVYSE